MTIHAAVLRLSRGMALAGGAMLTLLVLMTCASILGRELNELLRADAVSGWTVADWLIDAAGVGAIDGDFELLEAGMAFTVFAFLPWTQVTRGHASVDVLAARLPRAFSRWMAVLAEIAFAAVLILIAVQLWEGMASKRASGQVSLRLQFPVWWGYALAMVPAAAAALVGAYCAWARLVELRTGRTILAEGDEGRADP